jgi:hypothetical protein
MKRLTNFLFLFLLIPGISALAQTKATITFTKTVFDFGKIKELEGPKTGRFDFKNSGNDTLKILGVKVGFGFTANWTKTSVPPKGTGFVDVTYDPKGKPAGLFNKGVDVTTNDPDQPRITLAVKGEIEPRPRTVADDYPNEIGHLRFNTAQLALQNVNNTDSKTDTLKIINTFSQVMTFAFTKLPEYITCKAVPDKLKPNQKGYMLITYNAGKRNDFGFLYDRFTFETNDSVQPEKSVTVTVNIIEDFSKMTPEQLAKAAKIKFESTTYDFGTIKEGDKVETEFKFTNEGDSVLHIRKVKGS